MFSKTFLLFIILISIISLSASEIGGNRKIGSFSKAKKILYSKIYSKEKLRKTFYCGCAFKGKQVDLESCGYHVRKNKRRAGRVEAEHVVPASVFGENLPSWKNGDPKCRTRRGKNFKGRKCSSKVDNSFKFMEADLYNLMPAIGEVNGDRSNYSMSEIPGEPRRYGACDFEIEKKRVEPRPEIRGDIARVYKYMNLTYPGYGIISDRNRNLFEKWDSEDPVSNDECERAFRIEQIQGNRNVILENACRKMWTRLKSGRNCS